MSRVSRAKDWIAGICRRIVSERPLGISTALSVISLVFLLLKPNVYTSEVRVLPTSTDSGSLSSILAVAAAAGFGGGAPQDPDANVVDILNSRWLGEALLTTPFEYDDRSWRFAPPHRERGTLFDYVNEDNMDRAMKDLPSILSVNRDPKTNLLTFSIETRSPELSQKAAHRTKELLEEFLKTKDQTRGKNKAIYIRERLAEATVERDQAEHAFKAFLNVNRGFENSVDPAVRLDGQRIQNDLDLRRQVVSTLTLSLERALMDEKDTTPLLNVMDEGSLPVEKSKPHRAILLLMMWGLIWGGCWAWYRRKQLRARLAGTDEGMLG